ncbi:MAG: hypothetical protein H0W82_05470 [Actinobacteria bacterium]|nr:hypothetical protein [Actinomycetota bacterium]
MRRDEVTGVILHQPPCEAWKHGHMNCRHVQEMVHRAEQPARVFLDEFLALRSRSTWWASEEAMREFCVATIRLAETADAQREQIAIAQRNAEREPSAPGEAWREFA